MQIGPTSEHNVFPSSLSPKTWRDIPFAHLRVHASHDVDVSRHTEIWRSPQIDYTVDEQAYSGSIISSASKMKLVVWGTAIQFGRREARKTRLGV